MLRAIGFDLFETLLQAKGDVALCLKNIHQSLSENGINVPLGKFLETYSKVHEKNRIVRMNTGKEVSNRLELSEILIQLDYSLKPDDPKIVEAVKAYFSGWTVTILEGVETTLQNLRERFKIGVITNFTDSKYIYDKLSELNMWYIWDCIVVSVELGWRKTNPKIFNKFLQLMTVRADEALFVGDDVAADIFGAKAVGMKTALRLKGKINRGENMVKPDFTVTSVKELIDLLD